MKVWVHPRAEQDLEQPGLGTTVNAERRRMPLNVFPYAVIYRATSSELRVLAVKHDRQHPRFGSKRD